MNTEPNDAQLVALALKDKDKFAQLIDKYEAKLSRYIRRFTGLSVECIQDIIQEVFIKVYRNLNNFDQKLSFSSWIYRISHNESINYLRKHKNSEVCLETDDKDVVSLIEILADDTDVAFEAIKEETKRTVWKILMKLNPKYREILILKYIEDKQYKEISDILRKPMGTVATLLNRAKKHFKKVAQKHDYKF